MPPLRNCLSLVLLISFLQLTQAQVGIGTSTPHSSAQLQVSSNSKGFLLPSISLTGTNDASTIASPATGLLVYNTNTVTGSNAVIPGFYYYNGSSWVRLIVPTDNASITNDMLSGSIAASKLIGSDIATVGTITSGTWSGTTIAITNGGTGATTATGAIANLGVVASTEKGAINGVATLGSNGKIPSDQIPAVSFQSANVVASQTDMLNLSNAVVGSIAIRTDVNKNFVLSATPYSTLSNWIELATPNAITSVNGSSGPNVSITASSLSATTIGNNLFTLTNPDAISFPRFNQNNTVSALSASDFRTAIGVGTGNGSVTSVGLVTGVTGNDINVSGSPITSSGTITLNIPDASSSTRGVVTTAAQIFSGVKTFSAYPILSTATASQALFTDANKSVISNPITGTGNVVMSSSPTITTPIISSGSEATPSSIWILPTSHATSKRTTLRIDNWLLLQDLSADGNKNFSISERVSAGSVTFPSRFFINVGGNVGIGNVSPNARLDIRTNPSSTTDPGVGYLGVGTTTATASSAGAGAVRYNTTGSLEFSNGNSWVALASPSFGDIKSGIQASDHNGWVKLDGRSKSSLTTTQQAQATALGIGANLPNATDAYLVQNGATLGNVSGSNQRTITQANLPNVNFSTATTSSTGGHSHTVSPGTVNTTVNGGHTHTGSVGGSTWNGGGAWAGGFASGPFNLNIPTLTINSAGDHTHSVSIPTTTSSAVVDHAHTVTVSSGGSGTAINITPQSLSVNMFIYLGL